MFFKQNTQPDYYNQQLSCQCGLARHAPSREHLWLRTRTRGCGRSVWVIASNALPWVRSPVIFGFWIPLQKARSIWGHHSSVDFLRFWILSISSTLKFCNKSQILYYICHCIVKITKQTKSGKIWPIYY